MKNIIKNSIFVFALIGVFAVGANVALAAGPTISSAIATPSTNLAVLSGSVNPNGANTVAWYETPSSGPFQVTNIGSGTSAVSLMPYTLSGLSPNTSYSFRIVASDANGNTTNGGWVPFTTTGSSSSAPIIVSASATPSTNSAQLNGTVNGNGSSTTAWYETPSGGPFQVTNIGSGTVNLMPYTLSGLNACTAYTFRIVASNANGTTNGSWVSFTTTGCSSSSVTLTSISPSSGAQGQTLTVILTGTNFASGATSSFGAGITVNSTTFVGPSQLNANITIPASATAGGYSVTVTSGSQTSGALTFTVGAISGGGCGTLANISSLSPNSVIAGSSAVTVTINGSNFINGSVAYFGANAKTTTFISASQITMNLLASDVASAGSASVSVANSTGCNSSSVNFTISPASGGGGGGGTLNPPLVITQNSSSVLSNGATLNGSINPNGYSTTAWFEYGASSTLSSSSETVHVVQGSASSASALAQNINGLVPNTIYYFRAVANNSYGTIKGNIFSFQTMKALNSVITVQATNKASTSAKLNAIFINQNVAVASGHFEYGKTPSLGSVTAAKDLGIAASVSFSDTIANLSPNTTYYFRAVAVSQSVTYNGNILAFETPGAGIVPVEEDKDPVISQILEIKANVDNVSIGNEVEYLVTFKNTNPKNLENVKISVQLPQEVDFVESNFGKEGEGKIVTLDAGILVPAQVGSMIIKGKINSKAEVNSVLVTTAAMSYNIAGSAQKKDEIAYVINHVIPGSGLEANALFGADFLPSTLLGWLALILVILGLTVVGRKLYADYALKTAPARNADHIDQLPM